MRTKGTTPSDLYNLSNEGLLSRTEAYRKELENNPHIEVGSIVQFNATIKAHKEFKGIKTNVISTISI